MRCFILMGVSGCGKTSVGEALDRAGVLAFVDGDALHPKSNIDKMAQGEPLNDTDREPWLADVGRVLAQSEGPVVVGCSALKRKYRDWIRAGAKGDVCFLHLAASREVIAERLSQRTGHFMPKSLLDSQFEALEALEPDETGGAIDIDQSFDDVVAQCREKIREVTK